MRIVAGAWRGRALRVPPGSMTRPTADRVRQALFDMLLHASWGGRDALAGVRTLDAFAGTGALGLEALSRGASHAVFMENDAAALAVLRQNVAALGASATVLQVDAARPPSGQPCGLIFLDPPYEQGLIASALPALQARGWVRPDALIVAEVARDERLALSVSLLAERAHGAARLLVWRAQSGSGA